MMRRFVLPLSVLALMLGGALSAAQTAQTPADICASAPKDEPANRQYSQAETVLEAGVDYRAVFCTEAGAVYLDLYETLTPVTVNNFVFLAQNGYYNNTTFHRVLADFMAQGGDPTGSGSGGPGYQFEDEPVGFLTFDRPGLLAMANAGPGTNGSQFFITTAITDWLNYNHTIFGEVLEGQENVQALKLRDPQQNPSEDGARLETVVIITDPASITSTFEEDNSLVSAESISQALSELIAPNEMPPDLSAGDGIVVLSAEDVLQAESTNANAEAHYAGLSYRLSASIQQTGCLADYGFDSIGYVVDAYADKASASAALGSGYLASVAETDGFAPVADLPYLAFSKTTTDCTGAEAQEVRVYLQRGRLVVEISALLQGSLVSQLPVSPAVLVAQNISRIFEQTLSSAYRSELR